MKSNIEQKKELHDWVKCFIMSSIFNTASFAYWFFVYDKEPGLYLNFSCFLLVLNGIMFTLGTWVHGLHVWKSD